MVDGIAPVGVVVLGVTGTAVGIAAKVFIASVVNVVVRIVGGTADTTATTGASNTRESLADDLHSVHLLPLIITKSAIGIGRLLSQPSEERSVSFRASKADGLFSRIS